MTPTTKHENKLQFENFVVFVNFLKALLQHCSPELSLLRTPKELKLSLAKHPDIAQYDSILMDENFVCRWNKLFADCFTDWKYKPKSMEEKAKIIDKALSSRCDLLTKFNDFPAPPSNDKVDMKRYDGELIALMDKNKKMYNEIQKWFIDRCILTTRATIAALNLQSHFTGDCYKLKWRSLASSLECNKSPNSKIRPVDVWDYMKLACPGHCKCDDHGKSQNARPSANRPRESSISRTAEVRQRPKALSRASTVGRTTNVARSMAPEPVSDNDMNPIENVQPPASPPTPGVKRTVTFAPRPASEAAPKRPRQTPAREISDPTKFGKYAVFKQFLEVLLRNFSNELSRFKTPRDIKFFLADRPVMKPFQDLLMNDNFVTQWILLHNKCDPFPNAANTMETAAREIEFGLENKGSLIQHFADFPAKPQDNDVEDMARCIKEIMVMRNLGQSLYNINQKNYLKGFQSILKRKREKLLLNNSHNLPDVIQSRSSTYENGTSRAESVTVPQRSRAASLVPARDSPDGGSEIMTAIDYFMKENPNIPKADVFREFSYLAREARNRYEKMAEAASGNTY